ncbi:serine/threonine protein phosphatase PP2A-associated protein [Paxillus ammoniavirescens]|nr:serine/threonine protein phosphatase PP2A-associated protein [Paxillus ammoniavirescens]
MSFAPLPLPAQYARALYKASKAVNLPTIDDETQELIRDALSDLIQLNSRIADLSLFSPNETLEDISTRDLIYISIPYIRAEVQNRVRTTNRDERMSNLTQVQSHLRAYLFSLETFHIVSETEHALYAQQPSSIKDAAKRREVKIKQYKAEQDLRTRVQVVRKRRRQLASEDRSFNEFDLVASLLPSTETASDDDDEDSETDDVLREVTLLLLRLCYAQAYPQLESTDQEMELLRNAPPPPPPELPADERQSMAREQEDMWKIDSAPRLPGKGPLLDPTGKPLRPFTILPSGASDRARLQAQVFGPGHRLPTMSIDEYLEIERQRGGIISGGGPQSETEPTSSEQLTRNSEMDGTVFGELTAEEKRQKDEEWAQYKDAHARGAGNTMNRG